MQLTSMAQIISPIISPSMEAMGYDLVRVHWQDGANKVLQIMAERKDGEDISVEDCTEISHTISALLDVEDPITAAYNLEVSSPGIDRPLTKLQDFAEYQGYEVKVEMNIPQQGRKRFKGVIAQVSAAEIVTLKNDEGEYPLPYAEMANAKLVLSDALVQQFLKAREKKAAEESAAITESSMIDVN